MPLRYNKDKSTKLFRKLECISLMERKKQGQEEKISKYLRIAVKYAILKIQKGNRKRLPKLLKH